MRRQFIFLGVAALALLALASISATLAAPKNAPLLQEPEIEPNNSPDTAQTVSIPVQISGRITQTGPITAAVVDTDYFSFTTQGGVEYQADLRVDTVDGMKLQLRAFDSSEGLLALSSSSNSSILFSWQSSGGTNYIQVRKNDVASVTLDTKYTLEMFQLAATSTPTPSPTPTPESNWDAYEPNNSLTEFSDVSFGATLENLNFWPYEAETEEEANSAEDDVDVFRAWCKPGHTCQVETEVTAGVDTVVRIYAGDATDTAASTIAENDDSGTSLGSRVSWESSGDGYYKIWVENIDESLRESSGQTYELILTDVTATPTPTSEADATDTPAPPPTPDTAADSCEENSNFERACVIPVNKPKTFNFVPPYEGSDNDFYKIWVKSGLHFKCATSDLDPGVDPNIIVFTGPSWDAAIGGNDDIEPGNYNSAFSYYATYSGWLYVLLGTGDRTPSDIRNSSYTLLCEMWAPGEPTSTKGPKLTDTPKPSKDEPTLTPTPTTSESPIATPTPTSNSQNLTIRPLTTPTPAPTATTPSPRFIPIGLLIYYDANDDGQPGAGEGISGVSVQVYEVATGQLKAQDFTDQDGQREFTVAAQGPVRVRVPFLSFSQLVTGEGASIYLRVPPRSPSGGSSEP